MIKREQTCDLPFAPKDVFSIVSDVGAYETFLPWCTQSSVLSRQERDDGTVVLDAVIGVGYRFIQESFRSKANLDAKNFFIRVDYMNGPFEDLENTWQFEEIDLNGKKGCRVHFSIEFIIKGGVLRTLMESVFEIMFQKMFDAFIKRAHEMCPIDADTASSQSTPTGNSS